MPYLLSRDNYLLQNKGVWVGGVEFDHVQVSTESANESLRTAALGVREESAAHSHGTEYLREKLPHEQKAQQPQHHTNSCVLRIKACPIFSTLYEFLRDPKTHPTRSPSPISELFAKKVGAMAVQS